MAKVSTRNRNKNAFDKEGRPKKPNWEYRFEMAKVNGKRQHASKAGFRTQKEALAAGTQALAEYLNSGQLHKPNEISVSDYLDQYIDQYVKVNLRQNTQRNYSARIQNHIRPNLGHYKLQSLSPSTLQSFVNALKEKGFSKNYISGIFSTLKNALDYAVEPLQMIHENPAALVRMPKVIKEPRKRIVLTQDQWHQIIERYPFAHRFHIPLQIGYHTGMRIGEVLGLTWNDIDLVKGEISVNKQLCRYKKTTEEKQIHGIAPPKSKASERTIKIGQTLIDILKKERIRQKENKLACGKYYLGYEKQHWKEEVYKISVSNDEDQMNFVCVNEYGKITIPDSFDYCSYIIRHKLGIEFDFHTLRHTHATMLAESGINPKALQLRLGHEKIETTLNRYIHATQSMIDESVDVFEKILMSTIKK